MILVFGRKGFEWWLEFSGPVGLLGKEIGFCAVDYIGASRAVL